MSITVGILGSTGYTGCQLVSLLLNHQEADIRWLTSENFKGNSYSEVFPALGGSAVVNGDVVTALLEMPRHVIAHDAQTDEGNFSHVDSPPARKSL